MGETHEQQKRVLEVFFSTSSEGPLRQLPVGEQDAAYKRRKPSGISLGGFLHLKTAATYTPPSP